MRDVTDEGPTALQDIASFGARFYQGGALVEHHCLYFLLVKSIVCWQNHHICCYFFKPTFLLVRLVRQPFFGGKIVLVPTILKP